jgi:hypothetical protein
VFARACSLNEGLDAAKAQMVGARIDLAFATRANFQRVEMFERIISPDRIPVPR